MKILLKASGFRIAPQAYAQPSRVVGVLPEPEPWRRVVRVFY